MTSKFTLSLLKHFQPFHIIRLVYFPPPFFLFSIFYFLRRSPIFVLFAVLTSSSFSQGIWTQKVSYGNDINETAEADNSWSANMKKSKAFIENKGQFDGRNRDSYSDILYAVDNGAVQIFFTKTSLTYRFDKREKNHNRKEGDKSQPKIFFESVLVNMHWENSNPNTTIIAEENTSSYHSYSYYTKDGIKNINYIKGFEKLIYKNLYPKIDVEYVFHPKNGIKYSLILHPGADVTQVKMRYSESEKITLNNNGEIHVGTKFGNIIEHTPHTFYTDNKRTEVSSKFILNGKTISFELGNYNNTKTIVIDPWIQSPSLSTSNCVWECEKDGTGNVYIIGGDTPLKLQKYSSTGALQWTYNTPWDTTNGDWLGTIATDLSGNSYITNGSVAEIQKVNANGTMVWSKSASFGSSDEYWTIAFNCDQTKLIVGGTKGPVFPDIDINKYKGVIYDINTSDGSVTNYAEVTKVPRPVTVSIPGFPSTTTSFPNEVRTITSSHNARYYYLTHDTIGSINQNLSLCSDEPVFGINSTYEFSYKCEDWRPLITDSDGNKAGNSGICAIKANGNFVYTQNGITVHKRSLANGTILTSAAIPGGVSTPSQYTTPTLNQPGNSGIDIDSCGNIYVGSSNAVIKYDADLNLITSVATQYKVYDIAVSYNGEVIIAGATGNTNSTSRTGYVESINMSACSPMVLICCDATICPAGPLCLSSSPLTLTTATQGGTWSGPGVNASGVFDPAVAGVGTHTIIYNLGCGSDSIFITVNSCLSLTACKETNGNFTVTNGTGPFTWYEWNPGGSTSITNQAQCTACNSTYTWFFGQCLDGVNPVTICTTPAGWQQFAAGTTVTPTSNYPILVVSSTGDSLQITSATSLPNCTACNAPTVTISPIATTCGLNNGSATVNATGGSSPYTYNWSTSPAQNSQTATGLTAGNYSVTVSGGGCDTTASVTIASSSGIIANATTTDASCGANNGTATANASGGATSYAYQWNTNPMQTGQTTTGLAGGNYIVTVTDQNNCSDTALATVTTIGGPAATASATDETCNGAGNGTVTVNASGGSSPYSYFWNNGQTVQTMTGLFAGIYTVTVTDNTGCSTTASATITDGGIPTATTTSTNVSCYGGSNGTATGIINNATSPYSYNWSNGQTASTATGLSAGNYSVTITDINDCYAIASVTIGEPDEITATLSTDSASCGQANGSVTISPVGGISPYTYLWNTTPPQTGQNATGLAAGNYLVTVTDANNCQQIFSASINNEGAPGVFSSGTEPSCVGFSDGEVGVFVSGGSPPYTYLWSSGQTDSIVSGLTAETYAVTVTDFAGCIAVSSVILNDPPPVNTEITPPSVSVCTGGNVSLNASGGNTYTWSTGQSGSNISVTNITSDTAIFVTATDANSCEGIDSVLISINNIPVAVNFSGDTAVCTNGTANVTASGSGVNSPYSYLWGTGQANSSISVNNISSDTTFFVTVTDANNCNGTDSVSIKAIFVTVAISGAGTICIGQNATLTASGADAYVWSTNDSTNSIVVSPTYDSSFSVAGTNSLGCSDTDTVVVNVSLGIDAVVSNDTIIAFGTTVQVSASGGISYLWSTGETTSSIRATLEEDTRFIVTVTDAYGCADIDTINIKVDCKHSTANFVPTIFSPNGDGANEFIKIHGYGFSELEFIIYDRWGEKIITITDKNQIWDGTRNGNPLNSAVFVYMLKLKFCDETEYNEKGNITLVR